MTKPETFLRNKTWITCKSSNGVSKIGEHVHRYASQLYCCVPAVTCPLILRIHTTNLFEFHSLRIKESYATPGTVASSLQSGKNPQNCNLTFSSLPAHLLMYV